MCCVRDARFRVTFWGNLNHMQDANDQQNLLQQEFEHLEINGELTDWNS